MHNMSVAVHPNNQSNIMDDKNEKAVAVTTVKNSQSEKQTFTVRDKSGKNICSYCRRVQKADDADTEFCANCGNMMLNTCEDDVRSYDSNPLIAPLDGKGPKILGQIETPTS